MGNYRLGTTARQRKINTLMSAMRDDPHSYLSGYLTVKNLWINAIQSTSEFWDRDLFLDFTRTWFFQDWLLVDLLLDSRRSVAETASLLSERVQKRMAALARANLTAEVAIYDKEVGTNRQGPDLLRALRLEPSERRTDASMQKLKR